MIQIRKNHVQSAVIALLGIIIMTTCSGRKNVGSEKQSTGISQSDEWISLFDGKTLEGWKRYGASDIGSLWKVEDGAIVCYSEGGGEADEDQGGSLITEEQFDNFDLELDWKISTGGNSGILYHVVENKNYGRAYETGPEYQLLDESAYEGISSLNITASNYDMHPPEAGTVANPPGEWNNSRIVYNKGQVQHWLNGALVLEFEKGSEDWKARYEQSKWKEYPGWCKYETGSIGLQDHGHKIWFKNIRIKKL